MSVWIGRFAWGARTMCSAVVLCVACAMATAIAAERAADRKADAKTATHARAACPQPGTASKPATAPATGATQGKKTYGEAYGSAHRLQDEVRRTTRLLGCEPPLEGGYGARGAWDAIEGETREGKQDASAEQGGQDP